MDEQVTHLDIELNALKSDLNDMFGLVASQLDKAKQALRHIDKDLAHEVRANEKRVNGFELKIDRDCEGIIALYKPVATDLRLVLAALKINMNLERIGDIADGIAQFVVQIEQDQDKLEPSVDLLEKTRVLEMFDAACDMLRTVETAFNEEDTKLARKVFKKDALLDEINFAAHKIIKQYIKENPKTIDQCLFTLSTIRKVERVGDQTNNIAEEIIFYVDAKILKHGKKKLKDAPEL